MLQRVRAMVVAHATITALLLVEIVADSRRSKGGTNGGSPQKHQAIHDDQVHEFTPVQITWPDTKKYEAIKRMHEWCKSLHKTYSPKETESMFKNALENKNISVIMMSQSSDGPQFVKYNNITRTIEGGYIPEILYEVARRAGFHVKVAVVDPPEPSQKGPDGKPESYDSWLDWATDNYDVVAGAYAGTAERRLKKLRFGFPFMDSSPELVAVVSFQNPPLLVRWFSFHKPFSPALWLMITATLVITALTYCILEGDVGNDFSDDKFRRPSLASQKEVVQERKKAFKYALHSLWLTIGSFTAAQTFSPSTIIGKLFVMSWTFAILLLVSAYTANLAMFLIVPKTKTTVIKGISDAIKKNIPICVYKGGAFDDILQQKFPKLPLYYPVKWGYNNLYENNCGGIVKDSFWFKVDQGRRSKNPKCNLETIGMPFLKVSSSFVGKIGCSSLAMDVIDHTLHEMYNDGWFENAEHAFLAKQQDFTCSHKHAPATERMYLDNTMGIFILHGAFSIGCLMYGAFCAKRKRKLQGTLAIGASSTAARYNSLVDEERNR